MTARTGPDAPAGRRVQTLHLPAFPDPVYVMNRRTGRWETRHPPISPNARVHYQVRARAVREVKLAVAIAVTRGALVPMRAPILVDPLYVVPNERRRDPDNYAAMLKPVLDGLVEAGVLVADDRHHLTLGPVRWRVEKGLRRLELTLTEIDNAPAGAAGGRD